MQYYRNTEDIELPNGDYVEAGSLWKKEDDKMILVDEDRYVVAEYNEDDFEVSDSNDTDDN